MQWNVVGPLRVVRTIGLVDRDVVQFEQVMQNVSGSEESCLEREVLSNDTMVEY